jgi:prepilin-type N-terminal cleavage/methylation domain-containing protein
MSGDAGGWRPVGAGRVRHGFTLIEVIAAVVLLAMVAVAGASWFRSAGAAVAGVERRLAAAEAVHELARTAPSPAPFNAQPVAGHADWWWRVIDLQPSPGTPGTLDGAAASAGLRHHWRELVIRGGREDHAPILAHELVLVLDE